MCPALLTHSGNDRQHRARRHTYQLHVRRHIQPHGGNERLLVFLYVFSLIFFCIKRKYKTSEQRPGRKAATNSKQQRDPSEWRSLVLTFASSPLETLASPLPPRMCPLGVTNPLRMRPLRHGALPETQLQASPHNAPCLAGAQPAVSSPHSQLCDLCVCLTGTKTSSELFLRDPQGDSTAQVPDLQMVG